MGVYCAIQKGCIFIFSHHQNMFIIIKRKANLKDNTKTFYQKDLLKTPSPATQTKHC